MAIDKKSQAFKKYCAYRYAWQRQQKLIKRKKLSDRKITWAQWFEEMFHEPLVSYHERVMKRKNDATVRRHKNSQRKTNDSARI